MTASTSTWAREARHESLGIDAAQTNPQFTLVRDSKPQATIVTPEPANEREQFIAKDLQRIIEQMSGGRLPIKTEDEQCTGDRVQIGSTKKNLKLLNLDNLMPEGFRIKLVDNDLCLAGRDDAGTEFAVYTFLERYCDAGWFWPGDTGEVIPRKTTVAFGPIDDLEEPDFLLRRILVKPRPHLPSGDFHEAEKYILAPAPIETRLWRKRNRLGGSVDYAGTHTFGKMVPPEQYGPTHPQYFALVSGKRTWKNFNGKHGCQLCTTHPDVVELGIQWVREFLDEHPTVTCATIAPNDGFGFCECERCRSLDAEAGSPDGMISDRMFTFANQIAAGVKETHPERGVLMLAYSAYSEPPRKVTPAKNVWVQLCLNCDRFSNEEKRGQDYGKLSKWAKITEKLAIYEYYVWRGSADLPRSFTAQVEESIRRFHQHGSRLFFAQSEDNFGAYGVTYCVASRLLWNVDINSEDAIEEFCRKCFGEAGRPMQAWFQLIEDRWRHAVETEGAGLYGGSPAYWLTMFPPNVLAEARANIEEAKKLVNGEARQRVAFFEKEMKYTELSLNALRLLKRLEQSGVVKLRDDYPTNFQESDSYVEIDLASTASDQAPADNTQADPTAAPSSTALDLLAQTIAAWESRNTYIEGLRGQHVIDYWHVKEDADRDYGHDPTAKLKELLDKYQEQDY